MTSVLSKVLNTAAILTVAASLSSCEGIFSGIYDDPDESKAVTVAGQTYLDASDWTKWYYLDLEALADSVKANPTFNTSTLWQEYEIPLTAEGGKATAGSTKTDGSTEDVGIVKATEGGATNSGKSGIYTYWYDVFGAGISNRRFESFMETAPQAEPEHWSLAIHRNNVRTNGGAAAATGLKSFDELPDDPTYYDNLVYTPDSWDESNVWVIRDRMLLGYVGNQGITVNPVLSSWLTMDIPPMPPAFTHNDEVFILRLKDGTRAAIRLQNYRSTTGTACCMTINYRYPL